MSEVSKCPSRHQRFRHNAIHLAIVLLACAVALACENSGTNKTIDQEDTPTVSMRAVLGPIEGAEITLHTFPNWNAPQEEMQTTGGRFQSIGWFDISMDKIKALELYVITACDGNDHDADDDGIQDAYPTENNGCFHALLTGNEILSGTATVNIITEVIYRSLWLALSSNASAEEILLERDKLARRVLNNDLNGDGVIDGSDALMFNPAIDKNTLRHSFSEYLSAIKDIHLGLTPTSIANDLTDRLLARMDLTDISSNIVIDNNFAYIVNYNGFQVVDISNRKTPKVVGEIDIAYNSVLDLALSGDFAYVAAGNQGLFRVDINNPAKPTLLGAVGEIRNARAVSTFDGIAYVAADAAGLLLFDVSRPDQTPLLSSIKAVGDIKDLSVVKGTAYLVEDRRGIVVVDVANTVAPVVQSSLSLPGLIRDIRATENTVFIARNGVDIIDTTNPTTPELISTSPIETPVSIAISGHTLHVLANGNTASVQAVDISDPEAPVTTGFEAIPRTFAGGNLAVSDNIAYIANRSDELRVIDVAELGSTPGPAILASIPNSTDLSSLAVSGDYIFVADGIGGVQIIDAADPKQPTLEATVGTSRMASSISISNQIAYIANVTDECDDSGGGMQVIDISNPTDAESIANVSRFCFTQGWVTSYGNFAYLLGSELEIFDTRTPSQPISIAIAKIGNTRGGAVLNNYLYIAAETRGVLIIDLSDPKNPAHVQTIDTIGNALDITLHGNNLLVATNEGIEIFNVSDPLSPMASSKLRTLGRTEKIAISDNFAYLAAREKGLHVIDISKDALPILLGSFNTSGIVVDVAIADGVIFIADALGKGIVLMPAIQNPSP